MMLYNVVKLLNTLQEIGQMESAETDK